MTYHVQQNVAPEMDVLPTTNREDIPTKLVTRACMLVYADRTTYARGMRELEGSLPLTLSQEWQRNEQWVQWDGMHCSAAAEYMYVCGRAGERPPGVHGCDLLLKTFAGLRDEGKQGQPLAKFVSLVNEHVRIRLAAMGISLEDRHHLLTEEEVSYLCPMA